jgi:spermidine/putrescine transport system permease protein
VRRRRWPAATFAVLVLAFLYLPLVSVIANSFNGDKSLVRWGGFTTRWVQEAAENPIVRTDFVTTVEVALGTTVVSLVIAVTAGLWGRGTSTRGKGALELTTYMRLALPEIVLGVGLYVVFLRIDFPMGTLAIVCGQSVFISAFALIVINARLASMGTEMEEAAKDLGAGSWRIFRRVTMPALMPAVVVAGLLSFTLSADDVIVPLFLGGDEAETLPVLILGLARREVDPTVNVVGTAFMVFTLLCLALLIAIAGIRSAGSLGGSVTGADNPDD